MIALYGSSAGVARRLDRLAHDGRQLVEPLHRVGEPVGQLDELRELVTKGEAPRVRELLQLVRLDAPRRRRHAPTASSSDCPGRTSCQRAGFVNVRSTPPPSQLEMRLGRMRTSTRGRLSVASK